MPPNIDARGFPPSTRDFLAFVYACRHVLLQCYAPACVSEACISFPSSAAFLKKQWHITFSDDVKQRK